MRTVAIIQARMASSRLPGKVLMELNDQPIIGWCVRAALSIPGVDAVIVATSDDPSDDILAQWCKSNSIACVRGSQQDVLARFALAARQSDATHIIRLTADCPLLDPQVCGEILQLQKRTQADYASNVMPRTWPDGLDCEAFTADSLFIAEREARHAAEREHVTPFIRNQRQRFRVQSLSCPLPGLGIQRWTLDYEQDLAFLAEIASVLPQNRAPSYLEVLMAIDTLPGLRERHPIPAQVPVRQIEAPARFDTSLALLTKAEKVIPQASQTYSKSALQFPAGHTPLFLTHGEGGRVWDVDGNEYVDLICGLAPVMLGYADPDIDAAIRHQLSNGITFSLPTALEAQLAERIAALVPCAQKVRFAKNGSDATAAAIRLARAYTNRERIMTCGYHGWQDWSIAATTRHKGIPQSVRALTHAVAYNDLAAIDRMLTDYPNEFAALIMEPVNTALPAPGYLDALKTLLHRHGTLLIFDEVITGFRLAKGGAQEYLGVTPDLATFGKALGNGMPISAVTGRAEILEEMNHIFFSSTFGGETLSLSAAIAVLDKIQREPVIEQLWKTGERLRSGVDNLLRQCRLEKVIALKGLAPWVLLDFLPNPAASREAIKTFFVIRMMQAGVLIQGSHNICYAHDEADIAHVLNAYQQVLPQLAEELASGKLEERLPCPPIQPPFVIRPAYE